VEETVEHLFFLTVQRLLADGLLLASPGQTRLIYIRD
jgi:hypothetical protein